jgi:hypothetical protein
LKRRFLKWARITHLDIYNTNYGQKKGRESNWQFDSWSLKVGNWPDFFVCRQRATYYWKTFDKGYKFSLDFITIKGLHAKLCASKVIRVLIVGILGLPFRSPRTKSHLDVALVERCRVYYKGESGGFPQVQAVVSLMSSNCLWLVLGAKALQLCTNHLVFGFVQVIVSNWSLSILPSAIPKLQHALLPLQNATSQGACPDSLLFYYFQFGFTFESLKELGVCHKR